MNSYIVELNVLLNMYPRFYVDQLKRAPKDLLPSQVIDDTQPGAIVTKEGEEEYSIVDIYKEWHTR